MNLIVELASLPKEKETEGKRGTEENKKELYTFPVVQENISFPFCHFQCSFKQERNDAMKKDYSLINQEGNWGRMILSQHFNCTCVEKMEAC